MRKARFERVRAVVINIAVVSDSVAPQNRAKSHARLRSLSTNYYYYYTMFFFCSFFLSLLGPCQPPDDTLRSSGTAAYPVVAVYIVSHAWPPSGQLPAGHEAHPVTSGALIVVAIDTNLSILIVILMGALYTTRKTSSGFTVKGSGFIV